MSPSAKSAKSYLWLLVLAALLELLVHAERVGDEAAPVCETPIMVCAVSSNQPTSKPNDVEGLTELTNKCKQGTSVVVLMIQDYPDSSFPEALGSYVRKAEHRLSLLSARGTTCTGEASDEKHCGTVWVVVYALSGVSLDKFNPEVVMSAGGLTGSTAKGTVAVSFGINKKTLVVASTHGTEGVRAKNRKDETETCPKQIDAEWQRVQDFSNAADTIRKLQAGGPEVGVLWGGDFNPRTVWPDGLRKGCPMWWDGHTVNLAEMRGSRDILGSDKNGKLVKFSQMIADFKLAEADTSACPCPTYKKDQKATNGFACADHPDQPQMRYVSTHPPSWTDRIFHSTDAAWLQCDRLQRIRKDKDHDAVMVACNVCQ